MSSSVGASRSSRLRLQSRSAAMTAPTAQWRFTAQCDRYNFHNHDIVEACGVCQGRPVFHWQGDRSMLWSLRAARKVRRGPAATLSCSTGWRARQSASGLCDSERQWMTACGSFVFTDDLGVMLPTVVCPVRQYVGTDNVAMFPADPFALINYLTSVAAAKFCVERRDAGASHPAALR